MRQAHPCAGTRIARKLRPVELRPLNPSADELLSSLEQQEDVWEFVGTLPLPDEENPHHLFAIIEGQASVESPASCDRKRWAEPISSYSVPCDPRRRGVASRKKPASSPWHGHSTPRNSTA